MDESNQDKSLVKLIEKVVVEKKIKASEQQTINEAAFKRGLCAEEIMAVNKLTELIEKGEVQVA